MMKMVLEVKCLIYFFFINHFVLIVFTDSPHRRFEYKYSFKPPYLAQNDGSVPFWKYGGNAIASSENVRIASSLRSQKGAIWTKEKINFDWWEVDLVFRITGRGRIGADGLAFWYTDSHGSYNGSVFGSSDQWNGLGIFFDSFDNDNRNNNPYIMAVLNDGSKIFDHANDGASQLLAGCLRDFRNKPYVTRAKIEYYQNSLTLLFHGGMTNSEHDYDVCFKVENVYLPKNGYFGISAATGGLADDHDILHFLTTSLHVPGQLNVDVRKFSVEDEAKLSKEYQDYVKKFEQQRDDYHREHPNESNVKEELEEWFESDNQRELRQIFSGQTQAFDTIRALNKKLDEIIDKQDRILSLMTQFQSGDLQKGNIESGQTLRNTNTIQNQDIATLLTTQNTILNTIHDIKTYTSETKSKLDIIINNQSRHPTTQIQPVSYDYQSFVTEMRERLNLVRQDISQANGKLSSMNINCPTNNCLNIILFLIIITIQTIIVLGFIVYRNSKEAQAKKFY